MKSKIESSPKSEISRVKRTEGTGKFAIYSGKLRRINKKMKLLRSFLVILSIFFWLLICRIKRVFKPINILKFRIVRTQDLLKNTLVEKNRFAELKFTIKYWQDPFLWRIPGKSSKQQQTSMVLFRVYYCDIAKEIKLTSISNVYAQRASEFYQ